MSSGFVEQVRGTQQVSGSDKKKLFTQNNKQTLLCKRIYILSTLSFKLLFVRRTHDSLVNFMFSEDLVLAEDRTTEVDRELIMEGGT